MIRPAAPGDLSALLEYGRYFWQKTPYVGKIPYNAKAVKDLIETMMDAHYLIVSEEGTVLVGFLGMFLTPMIFNPDYVVATEVFFFVDPAHRGKETGASLFARAEYDLADIADILSFGDMTTSTDMADMYTRNGYVYTERAFTKVL